VIGAEEMSDWLGALRMASTFEQGCTVLTSRLRAVMEVALGERDATLARALVHLRSEGQGYRALAVDEWSGVSGHAQVAPSATVWRWVERNRRGIAVDLGLSRGAILADDRELAIDAAYVSHEASASAHHLLARETTHLVALPLTASGGHVAGMVSLELSWAAGIGAPWPRGEHRTQLQLLCDVAAPFLLALPPAPIAGAEHDPLLPVMGARTRGVVRVLSVFVDQDETLLLCGPTGSGKSRLAEWCHARSKRSAGPFEVANLLAVPEAMQMAELFGWRRGAFTGATEDREGLVAAANGGTLFLDEIDKLSLGAQAGLLRFLETRRYSPLGASREVTAEVRFIVGTNADLPRLVESGAFREDLFYRINVLPIRLEALAERVDEIPGWAQWMLQRRHGSAPISFTDDALAAFAHQSWPGNLRQLDNVVRRSYAFWLADDAKGARIDASFVRRALAAEGTSVAKPSAASVAEAIAATARVIVEKALEVRRRGGTMQLDGVDVLRGAVLRAAQERVGDLKDAYLLFGAESLVRSRNHTKDYRRHLALLEDLERSLDE
jgi:energy-coupling factor transporter ATP-binding protein EcfA2